jgi:periplasmic protein CpxP/Spy
MRCTPLISPTDSARRPLALMLATVAVAAASFLAQPAHAEGRGHGGMQTAMMGGPGGGMFNPRMAERLLDSVNATSEQKSQIKALADAARQDMQAQRDSGKALREQAAALFVQPTVDARAAEVLRQQMLAQHDQASKRMTQLMLDVSRVLTPEQRKQMAERLAQRRSMMERHDRERRQVERPTS